MTPEIEYIWETNLITSFLVISLAFTSSALMFQGLVNVPFVRPDLTFLWSGLEIAEHKPA